MKSAEMVIKFEHFWHVPAMTKILLKKIGLKAYSLNKN